MKTSNHIFDDIAQIEPPTYLKEAVLRRVAEARAEKIWSKKVRFRCGFAVAGILTVISGIIFGKELVGSEFWSLASLSFTDANVLLAHWQEFGYSLLETFPSIAMASILAPIFVLMVLTKKYAEQQPILELKF